MDSKVQSRLTKQRTEIARLTQALEKCAEDKRALLADLKYWKAECESLLELTRRLKASGTLPHGKP